jgi:VanZ family protein
MLLSLAVETAQVFIVGRYPQVSDVLLNGLSAWIGAILFGALKKNLKMLFPVYAVYLPLISVWPTTPPLEQWQFNIRFEELAFNERIVFIFRFIEYVAAFTLLGYMIAEMRGRKNETLEKTLGLTFFIAVAAAIFTEVLKTYPAFSGINILSIIIIISACIYGAVIYRLQFFSIV